MVSSASTVETNRLERPHASSWRVVWMLARREWTRFFRQRSRVVGGLGQPILFWLLFGTGMHSAFRGSDNQSFMHYYVPGTVGLILLFTAIFATISIIEDRAEGFLQNVLVAPVPRWTIAGGKVLGGAVVAWVQAMLFLLLAAATGNFTVDYNVLPLFALTFVASLGLTALGVCFAWPMKSTQGFHAIMSLVLLPMWLLSGAFFPIPLVGMDAPIGQLAMHWVMRCNPVSYMIGGFRQLMNPSQVDSVLYWTPSLTQAWLITFLFTTVTFLISAWLVQRSKAGDAP